MDIGQKFNDAGVSATEGVQIMNMMDIEPAEFMEPRRFEMFKDIVAYMRNVDEKSFFINRVAHNKPDKLKVVWEYARLSQKKEQLEKEHQATVNEMSIYEK